MITKEQAIQIAIKKIGSITVPDDSCILLDKLTIETNFAWIFFYNSKRYNDTKNMSYHLAGNSPLFISKTNGNITTYSSSLDFNKMITQYKIDNNLPLDS